MSHRDLLLRPIYVGTILLMCPLPINHVAERTCPADDHSVALSNTVLKGLNRISVDRGSREKDAVR